MVCAGVCRGVRARWRPMAPCRRRYGGRQVQRYAILRRGATSEAWFCHSSPFFRFVSSEECCGFPHFDGGIWRKHWKVPRNFRIVPRNDFILPRFLAQTAAECALWVVWNCAATPVPDGDGGVLGRILYGKLGIFFVFPLIFRNFASVVILKIMSEARWRRCCGGFP